MNESENLRNAVIVVETEFFPENTLKTHIIAKFQFPHLGQIMLCISTTGPEH